MHIPEKKCGLVMLAVGQPTSDRDSGWVCLVFTGCRLLTKCLITNELTDELSLVLAMSQPTCDWVSGNRRSVGKHGWLVPL